MNKILGFILFIIIPVAIFAQNEVRVSTLIKVKLVKSLNVSKVQGNLDFGEVILNGEEQKLTKAPNEGVEFLITGHPGKETLVTYKPAVLTRKKNNTSQPLIFMPAVFETGKNKNFVTPKHVKNGSSVQLENQSGIGKTYIWIGGKIDIPPTNSEGNYEGIFTLSVAY